MMRKFTLSVVAFVFAVSSAMAGNGKDKDSNAPSASAGAAAPNGTPAASPSESEFRELRDLLLDQQKRIEELETEVNEMKHGSSSASATESSSARSAESSAPASVAALPSSAPSSLPTASPAAVGASPSSNLSANAQGDQHAPLSFKIGDAEFTPGGFLDFTSFTRTENLGSGIATSFGTVPFKGTPQSALTESRLSSQYSRLSLKVHADVGHATSVTGYVEADFLGFQPANAYQTANSNSLRERVYWVDVRHGKWEVLGGQEWSMLEPNRVGISPDTADVFYTQNEDPNFQVGLIWARQAQFRVVYHANDWWTIGASLENPDQFVPASVVFPSDSFASQFDNGSGSTSAASSGTNTAAPTLHPDIVVKSAFDWKPFGHSAHVEVAGVVRSFKAYNSLAAPSATTTITGGGGSVNANYALLNNFRLIGNSFYSCGGGRYIFGLGPDVVVRPNGTLACVHSGAGIGGFEWQTTPQYLFAAYYGAAYYERNFGLLPATGSPTPSCDGQVGFTCVGFGFPGSPNSANRAVQEATFDFVPTLWSSPNYGKLQLIAQYSYLTRAPWWVATGDPKNAHLSMIYLDVRYVLP
jgi:hypothetical protein